MAKHDIMPFNSPHGGTTRVSYLRINDATSSRTANTSHRQGEVLVPVTGDCGIVIANDGTVFTAEFNVVAASDTEGEIQMGNLTDVTGTNDNWMVPVWRFEMGQEWITQNLFSGTDTAVVPTTEHIGDYANFWRNNAATGVTANGENGTMGLDLGTQTGTPFLITRVLDSNKRDILISGNTGVFVVFRPLGSNTI